MKHEQLMETVTYLKEKGLLEPEIGLVLGSGLGDLADEIVNPVIVSYPCRKYPLPQL